MALLATLAALPARADDVGGVDDVDGAGDADGADDAGGAPAAARPGSHWAVGAGGFAGLTGPAGFGPAAEVHVYPGGAAGHLGAGLRYRGFEGTSSGLLALGLTHAAGVARPGLVLELHGEAGMAYGPRGIAAGGGVRAQLGLWGPLTLAIDTAGHFLFDGAGTRLAIAPALTVGLTR